LKAEKFLALCNRFNGIVSCALIPLGPGAIQIVYLLIYLL